jgi:hypothetical protein
VQKLGQLTAKGRFCGSSSSNLRRNPYHVLHGKSTWSQQLSGRCCVTLAGSTSNDHPSIQLLLRYDLNTSKTPEQLSTAIRRSFSLTGVSLSWVVRQCAAQAHVELDLAHSQHHLGSQPRNCHVAIVVTLPVRYIQWQPAECYRLVSLLLQD